MVGICSPFSIKIVLCTCTQITDNNANPLSKTLWKQDTLNYLHLKLL